MKLTGNTVLITGGATGIGFSFAEALVTSGNQVIICGRREEKLKEAARRLPSVVVRKCDLADPGERKSFCDWVGANFRDVNVLMNNAAVLRRLDLRGGVEALVGDSEIEINLAAPVYLSAYFVPHFLGLSEAAIINFSSGIAFVPKADAPVYSATKAAIHAYTLSLRHQLRGTSIKVFEIIPPIVDTEMGRLATKKAGIPPAEFVVTALKAVERDEYEIPVGEARNTLLAARENFEAAYAALNP